MTPGESRIGIAGIIAFLLSFLLAAASGLMIAPLVALLGMVVFPFNRTFWRPGDGIWILILASAFLAWVGISYLWSPHDDPEQIPKLLLGVPLYAIFALRVGSLDGVWRARVEASLLFMMIALVLMGVVEILTDGSVTRSFKLAVEGGARYSESDLRLLINKSLGHGAAPMILLAGPTALIAWREGGPIIAGLIVLLVLVISFAFETQVNAAAFLLASLAAGLAAVWPRESISLIFGGVAGLLIVMPFIMVGVIEAVPEAWIDRLPLSWQWRLEIWTYASDLIQQKFLIGHGLDASRAINDTMRLGEHDIDLLPLHPHNAALQIWLETGLVGVVLLAGTLVACGGRIAGARRLSRIQAVGVAWVFTSYVSLVFFSYGVWQEWHQGAVALAVTATLFLGAHRRAG